MDSDKLAALALAFPILAATATPGVAQACPGYYEPCLDYDFWQDLAVVNATKIPSDGVVVLQGTHQGDDAQSLPTIELTVTKDGQPLAGALEATSLHGVLVWRPSSPWEAGATYALAGTVTNPPESGSCAPPSIGIEATLNIDVAPGAALESVDFTGEAQVQVSPHILLTTLACCEGATPSISYGGCGGPIVTWDAEECAPIEGHGVLSLQLDGQPAATGAAAAQIVYTLKVNDSLHSVGLSPQFSLFSSAPICAVIDATDLASGAVSQGQEHCFGDAVADMLGPQALDPTATLQCALEQCAPNREVWDPKTCTPFDPSQPTSSDSDDGASDSAGSDSETAGVGEGDKGCGCNTRSSGDAGLLALVGLVGLAGLTGLTGRRRRRR